MAQSERRETVLEFGPFRIDPSQRLLWFEGGLVPLEPKVFDTLLALVEAEGRLLTKDELLQKVWPGTFVEEGSLARNVSTLRKVFGEGADTTRYIETIPKRGYRFLATVRAVPPGGDVPSREPTLNSSSAHPREPSGGVIEDQLGPARRTRQVPRRLLLAAVTVAAAAASIVLYRAALNDAAAPAPAIRSLAVLPLQNLTGDPEQDYFSDGTTEQLIATLAQVHALRVISRTSVMRYKGTTKSLREIARELGVDTILEGSIQRSNGTVRLTTQLVDADTDAHLWAKTFDADLSDLLKIQADVARSVAEEVKAQLTPADLERLTQLRTVSPAAQDEVFRGHAYRWRGLASEGEDARKAIAHYSRAIELQPDYAMGYAGLALAWGVLNDSASIESARTAAERAIELDPRLAEAHAALAAVRYRAWDWEAGHSASRRALAISPGSLDGCLCYTIALAATGQVEEARAVAEQGLTRNPLSGGAHFAHGLALHYARRYSEAILRLRQALEIDSRFTPSYAVLAYAYQAAGQPQEAVALLEQPAFRNSPYLAIAYARAGRRDDALRLARTLATSARPPESIALARLYFALGDEERGLAWLTRAIDAREPRTERVIEEGFDSVRSDPRFRSLVARLNFPQSYEAFFNSLQSVRSSSR